MKLTHLAAGLAALCLPLDAHADEVAQTIRADDHAPIGVMADHGHAKGEWMVSYRAMRMQMDGSRIGADAISPAEIATTIPNAFAPPPTLRVVPLSMSMDMHMFGLMYAPSDRVTFAAMASYRQNDMDHVTFQGMMGSAELGRFSTRSSGWGDTQVSALVNLDAQPGARTVLRVGLSVPTGSIDETDAVLTPMNTRPSLVLPYPMQLGSGTVDPVIGVTHARQGERWGWGAQGTLTARLFDNDRGWRRGDAIEATAWTSYAIAPALSVSARLSGDATGAIEGRDGRISAPVQTADPDRHGGERLSAGIGVNYAAQKGVLRGHRFALEANAPIYQDLNGPQLETDWTVTLGWQRAWGGR